MAQINEQQMLNQETKDYNTTKKIMEKIFEKYGTTPKMKQMDKYCSVDARMNIKGKRFYTIEIKERNTTYKNFDLLLTCQKYANIKDETKNYEKAIVVYLVNGEQFFILDLKHIDWNKVETKNIYINDIEFSDNPKKEKVATFIFPTSQAIISGKI